MRAGGGDGGDGNGGGNSETHARENCVNTCTIYGHCAIYPHYVQTLTRNSEEHVYKYCASLKAFTRCSIAFGQVRRFIDISINAARSMKSHVWSCVVLRLWWQRAHGAHTIINHKIDFFVSRQIRTLTPLPFGLPDAHTHTRICAICAYIRIPMRTPQRDAIQTT